MRLVLPPSRKATHVRKFASLGGLGALAVLAAGTAAYAAGYVALTHWIENLLTTENSLVEEIADLERQLTDRRDRLAEIQAARVQAEADAEAARNAEAS